MASLVAETTWACINGDDDYSNGVEISKFNSALLMSLLEESHGEEYNDEQVNRVIQSLEAEIINANTLEAGDHDLDMEPEFLATADGDNKEDGQNCLALMEFEWAENMDHYQLVVPSSPSDDMNWYMENCGNELDGMVEFGDIGNDYSDPDQIFNVVSLEEHGFRW